MQSFSEVQIVPRVTPKKGATIHDVVRDAISLAILTKLTVEVIFNEKMFTVTGNDLVDHVVDRCMKLFCA